VPAAAFVAVALLSVSPASAASPVRFSGILSGLVTDGSGKPQPGASVSLFNSDDRLLQRSASDASGAFSFNDLLPDLYSVRITLATFVPASRDRVQVKPGMRSLLEVNLSRVFSAVYLVSTAPASGGLMSEDWKWALRTDTSLRPILRILPNTNAPAGNAAAAPSERTAVFSESRGFVRVSAGDGMQAGSASGEADLGTQFAFATSVYGGNHVKVSGNLGYASSTGTPGTALRTTYSRDFAGASPAVSVTMRQFRAGQSLTGGAAGDSNVPALRTMAISFADKTQISDSLMAEYGFELDSISFLDHLHYFSPYSKLSYALPRGAVTLTWSSGNARPELGMSSTEQNADLQRDLAVLAMLPRLTLENSRVKVQRGDDYEVGISQRYGSREIHLSAYRENISNTTLTIANPEPGLFGGDLLPDLFSKSGLFNAGHYQDTGYLASVTQDMGDNYKVTASYGSIGVMDLGSTAAVNSAADLRKVIEAGRRAAFTLRASGTVKPTGTRFVASYQWADMHSAMPAPLFSTQSPRPDPGFNIIVRQPLPSFPGMPGRIEASAELRNLLAQGYLPVMMSSGRQMLLVNTPRSLRGGFAFVF